MQQKSEFAILPEIFNYIADLLSYQDLIHLKKSSHRLERQVFCYLSEPLNFFNVINKAEPHEVYSLIESCFYPTSICYLTIKELALESDEVSYPFICYALIATNIYTLDKVKLEEAEKFLYEFHPESPFIMSIKVILSVQNEQLKKQNLFNRYPNISSSNFILQLRNLPDYQNPQPNSRAYFLGNVIEGNYLNLSRADLSKMDLSTIDINNANLYNANLSGANFSRRHQCNINLCNTNLSGITLGRTTLSKINLTGVDLSQVELDTVRLKQCDLTKIVFIHPNQLNSESNLVNKLTSLSNFINFQNDSKTKQLLLTIIIDNIDKGAITLELTPNEKIDLHNLIYQQPIFNVHPIPIVHLTNTAYSVINMIGLFSTKKNNIIKTVSQHELTKRLLPDEEKIEEYSPTIKQNNAG